MFALLSAVSTVVKQVVMVGGIPCESMCDSQDKMTHAANHGVVFQADSSFYMQTASHITLMGGPNAGTIVDATKTKGCVDNWKAFGCRPAAKKTPHEK